MRCAPPLLLAVMLTACSNEPSCPNPKGLYCSEAEKDLTCEYDTSTCRCNGATWTCTDCPDGEYPTGACSAGESCSAYGFENACACTCDANGAWKCVVDDPSPNFHCSF